jgi:hypothetical protein
VLQVRNAVTQADGALRVVVTAAQDGILGAGGDSAFGGA